MFGGNTYPKMQLREQIWDEEFTTGSSLPDMILLAHDSIVEDSETVTNLDGTVTYKRDTDYTIDYGKGRITVLDTGGMQPDTTYKIDYEYVYQERTFGADTGTNIDTTWKRVILGQMVTQSGEIKEWKLGERLVCTIRITEINVYSATDFIRMAYLWRGADRRVILYPRPGNWPGYEVIPDSDFHFDYPGGVWKGQILVVRFISKRVFEIPPHTGGTGDA